MTAFSKGDRVAWHHGHGIYAPGTVLYESAAADGAILGTVRGPANDAKTWYEVELDKKPATAPGYEQKLAAETFSEAGFIVLTQDELVKVAPDA